MHFRDAMILTLESDVYTKSNYLDLNACLDSLHGKDWSCVHVGGSMSPGPFINCMTPYRDVPDRMFLLSNAEEDLASMHDDLRYSRRFHTRCTDSLLWQSNGIEAFLKHMYADQNYGAPFDYYFINKLENDMSFKHYWSYTSYFDQRSNEGLEHSTIQSDTS
jgi:hypothetical protein